MKNTSPYSKALTEVALKKFSSKEEGDIVKAFVKLLEKNLLLSKSKEILQKAEEKIMEHEGKRKIVFETARPLTKSQRDGLLAFTKKSDVIEEKIVQDLISGVKIIIDEKSEFDYSMKKKLENIYNLWDKN